LPQGSMASSTSSRKRRHLEKHEPLNAELDANWCCDVCLEVLLDPVTLRCGHSLDLRCLATIAATAQRGAARRACPTCRRALGKSLPGVNIKMRNMVEQLYGPLVRRIYVFVYWRASA
jgi:hypothetical protein